MYSFDDMSCTNPAAPNVMKSLSIQFCTGNIYETLYEEISTKIMMNYVLHEHEFKMITMNYSIKFNVTSRIIVRISPVCC